MSAQPEDSTVKIFTSKTCLNLSLLHLILENGLRYCMTGSMSGPLSGSSLPGYAVEDLEDLKAIRISPVACSPDSRVTILGCSEINSTSATVC